MGVSVFIPAIRGFTIFSSPLASGKSSISFRLTRHPILCGRRRAHLLKQKMLTE